MRFVAFFRNVNLGRPGSPSKAQLVSAFIAAGAKEVDSFLTHGNATFSASSSRGADVIAEAAREHLRLACGLIEPVYTRSLRYLAELVASEPFATAPDEDVYQRCVSFLPAGVTEIPEAPITTPRRDVEVFHFLSGEAFSVTRTVGGRSGYANGLLERVLRTRLTTRNWNTIVRLVRIHA